MAVACSEILAQRRGFTETVDELHELLHIVFSDVLVGSGGDIESKVTPEAGVMFERLSSRACEDQRRGRN